MLKKEFTYKKILIVGCGGAGKSTLAVEMGKRFSLPVIHLDKIWWLPNWITRTREEFDELLGRELKKSSWIIDGNYNRTFHERLKYADFCIFLDYPTRLCLKSAYERVERYKGKTRPDITEGCAERVDSEFEEWIKNFKNSVRPFMKRALKKGNVPYKIFRSRKSTEKWLKRFSR